MGSMCAKNTGENDADYLSRSGRSAGIKIHRDEEEVEPLVEIAHGDAKESEDVLLPPGKQNKNHQSRSPSPSSLRSDGSHGGDEKQEAHIMHEVVQGSASPVVSDEEKAPDYLSDNDENTANTPLSTHQQPQQQPDAVDLNAASPQALPKALAGTPVEETITMDDNDKQIAQALRQKYANEIREWKLDRVHFVERYTVGYRHIKMKKRMAETCKDSDFFVEMYKRYKLNEISHTESSDIERDAWKQFMYGEDQFGHPVMYDLIGSSDTKMMKKAFIDGIPEEEFGNAAYRHMFRFMLKVERYKVQNSKKFGCKIYKQIQVLDMKQFTSDHLKGKNRKMTKMMVATLTRMFPEETYKMYVINAAWGFRALWGVLKGFMDPITVRKTKVLGEDYLTEMVKDIPIEMIPPSYGGKGKWEIQYGSVPKHYPISVDCALDE